VLHSPSSRHSSLLKQVDLALRDMMERKAASAAASMSEEDAVGAGVAQASLDLSDSMSEGLRLRSEMTRAVNEERWAGWLAVSGCGRAPHLPVDMHTSRVTVTLPASTAPPQINHLAKNHPSGTLTLPSFGTCWPPSTGRPSRRQHSRQRQQPAVAAAEAALETARAPSCAWGSAWCTGASAIAALWLAGTWAAAKARSGRRAWLHTNCGAASGVCVCVWQIAKARTAAFGGVCFAHLFSHALRRLRTTCRPLPGGVVGVCLGCVGRSL
jgi:hypothetical protein